VSGRLAGKAAIVTGAASGIGFATAALFVAEGARVIASDLGMPELEGTVGVAADAGDEAAVQGLIERAQKDFGGLDIFFANAGVSGGLASLYEQSVEDWEQILRVNLIGPFLGIKHRRPGDERGRRRVDYLHRVCRGNPRRRRRSRLFCLQGRSDQSRAGCSNATLCLEHPGQRHLPGPHRDRHDEARL
jgi:NAD(P)-dependent dehydrogenase (short-subunit alcohol dehydrogenase family)